jgi:sugar O-acyltransferase (sialic acid O-acetyltransferase NeuD family)
MAQPLILFGTGDIARIAHFYFTHDSDYEVVAYTVDKAYLTESVIQGCPVVPFEEIEKHYPPDTYPMFIALSYAKINKLRAERFDDAKNKGYRLVSYVSSKATTWPDLTVGENCFILEDNTIQPFVKIGNNVTLWSGNHIGHDSQIEDHCFLASHIVVSGFVNIEPYCFVGVNATFRHGIKVARECVIGAGAVILHDTEPQGVYKPPKSEKHRLTSAELPGL